jgi:hypothetical protein
MRSLSFLFVAACFLITGAQASFPRGYNNDDRSDLRRRRRAKSKSSSGKGKGKGYKPDELESVFFVEFVGSTRNPTPEEAEGSVSCFIETYNQLMVNSASGLKIDNGEVKRTEVKDYQRNLNEDDDSTTDDGGPVGTVNVLYVLSVGGTALPGQGPQGGQFTDPSNPVGGPPGGGGPVFNGFRRLIDGDLPTETELWDQLRENIKGICADRLKDIKDSSWLEEKGFSKSNGPSNEPSASPSSQPSKEPSKSPSASPSDSPSYSPTPPPTPEPTGKATKKSEKSEKNKRHRRRLNRRNRW